MATGNSTEQYAAVSRLTRNEYGLGVVAARDLGAGVPVARFEGDVVPYEAIPEAELPYVLNLETGDWLIPRGLARYANHSCDPNCRIDDRLRIVTKRPVAAGEELTYSYVLVDRDHYERCPEAFFWHERWTFDCMCGSPNCIGRVDRYVFGDEA